MGHFAGDMQWGVLYFTWPPRLTGTQQSQVQGPEIWERLPVLISSGHYAASQKGAKSQGFPELRGASQNALQQRRTQANETRL